MNAIQKIQKLLERIAESELSDMMSVVIERGKGISLSFNIDDDGEAFIDLDFQTKIGGKLYYDEMNEEFVIKSRYDQVDVVHDGEDILREFRSGFLIRDFGHHGWLELAAEYGVMKKNVQTVVSYS